MSMTEYIIVGLVAVILGVLYGTRPKVIHPIVIRGIIKLIKKNEPFIVQSVYNAIPKSVKRYNDAENIAEFVGFVILAIIHELEDFANHYDGSAK